MLILATLLVIIYQLAFAQSVPDYPAKPITLIVLFKATYHSVDDIEPICLVVSDLRLFAVWAEDARFKDAKDLINFARQNPGKLTIATSDAGPSGHLSILALNKAAKVLAKPVHFGGAGEV